jgi:predicted permease
MRFLAYLRSLTVKFFHRPQVDREMEEELRGHIQERADDLESRGLPRAEAERRARVEFGGYQRYKEECREALGTQMLREIIADVRYGLRQLARNPGFTLAATISLALGIGANTTIFSYVNALLLRPPSGVMTPDKLMSVWNRMPGGGNLQQSYPDYLYYRDHNRVFSGLAAYGSDPERVSWKVGGDTELIYGQLVSGNFFSVLRVTLALGRGFLPQEDQVPLRNPVVVLSHGFWQNQLGSDVRVIGKTLTLNGRKYTVVGVAPAGFEGVESGYVPDFWAPIAMQPEISPDMNLLTNRDGYWLFAVGRPKPGITAQQVQANLSVLEKRLAQAFPKSHKGWDAAIVPFAGLPPEFRGVALPFAALLMTVVGLVLLMACANAANLLLARATRRSREMAIRSALGASRGRIIRQILTECALLSLAAGGLALWLSVLVGPLLQRLKPPMLSFIHIPLPIDWRMLAFALVISLVAGFAFGIAPALRSAGIDVVSRLKDEITGSHRGGRLRNILVTGQVAVCTVLLIAAGLCLRSLMAASSVDPGFRVKNRLAVTLDVSILGYPQARGRTFYRHLAEEVQSLPGVESASIANHLPLGFESDGILIGIAGHQPPPGLAGIPIGVMAVGPAYFHTMGTRLLLGREFTPRDRDHSPGVAIINEAMAKRYWPSQDAVGKHLTRTFGKRERLEIVGVVKTGKYQNLREEPQPFMFRPFAQGYTPQAVLVVHTQGDPKAELAAVEREVHTLDPNLPAMDAETLSQYMSIPLFVPRVAGTLLGAFGLLALALAVVGLSGVVAYFVSLRTREIGVHVALGAERLDVLMLIEKQGIRLSIVGLAIGLAAAVGVSRVLSSLLYGIGPTDPVTYVGVSVLMIVMTLLSCYIPARRAMKVDPMVALRYE